MSTIWLFATLKRIEKFFGENAFDEKKKRPGLKFNPGLALNGLQTTQPRKLSNFNLYPLKNVKKNAIQLKLFWYKVFVH